MQRLLTLLRPLNLHHCKAADTEAVRFEASKGKVLAFGSNGEMTLIVPMKEYADPEGTHLTVPYTKLRAAVRLCHAQGTVNLKVERGDTFITIATLGVPVVERCRCLKRSDFPVVDTQGFESGVHLRMETMERIANALRHASTDETRIVLNGVRLDGENHTIIGVDGRVLYAAPAGIRLPWSVTLPTATVAALLALMPKGGPIWVKPTKDRAAIMALLPDDVVLLSAEQCGTFPNWKRVVPETHAFAVTLTDLTHLTRLTESVSSEKSHMDLRLKHGKLECRFRFLSESLREPTEWNLVPEAQDPPEHPFTITLDSQYVLNALRSLKAPTSIRIIDELSPTLFHDGEAMSIIMPLRRTPAT